MSDSCDPMNYSLRVSSVHRIFQAWVLEWVAISFSRGSSWPRDQTQVSTLQARALPSEPLGKYIKGGQSRSHWEVDFFRIDLAKGLSGRRMFQKKGTSRVSVLQMRMYLIVFLRQQENLCDCNRVSEWVRRNMEGEEVSVNMWENVKPCGTL